MLREPHMNPLPLPMALFRLDSFSYRNSCNGTSTRYAILAHNNNNSLFKLLNSSIQFNTQLKPSFEQRDYGHDTLPRKKKLLKLDSTADLRKEKVTKPKVRKHAPKPPRMKPKDDQSIDLYSSVELEDERLFDEEAHNPLYEQDDEEEDVFTVHRGTVLNDRKWTETEQTIMGRDREEDQVEAMFIRKKRSEFASRDELYGEDSFRRGNNNRNNNGATHNNDSDSPDDDECQFMDNTPRSPKAGGKEARSKVMKRVADLGKFSQRRLDVKNLMLN